MSRWKVRTNATYGRHHVLNAGGSRWVVRPIYGLDGDCEILRDGASWGHARSVEQAKRAICAYLFLQATRKVYNELKATQPDPRGPLRDVALTIGALIVGAVAVLLLWGASL